MSSHCVSGVQSLYYSSEELISAQQGEMPAHVAIIMDGNRRWAKKKKLSPQGYPLGGHWVGADVLTTIVEAAADLGIRVLTVYAFSTENWSRPSLEIETLFHICKTYLRAQRQRMVERGVRFQVIGDLHPLPSSLQEEVKTTQRATARGDRIDLVMALNYGGRKDICRAVRLLAEEVQQGKRQLEEITEGVLGAYLDTAPYGDPDLLIRTSGEMRLSNFLLWESAYSEFYMTPVLWPDYTPQHLLEAVKAYQTRNRRKGG